ncbi:hypothetical protein D3C77_503450 [compost metagenome]
MRRTAAELDERGAGNAGQGQLRLGVFLYRCIGTQAHLGQHSARVLGIKAQTGDIPHLDTAVLHRTTPGQTRDRFVEDHFVVLEGAVDAGFHQPEAKQHGAGNHNDCDQAD